MIAVPVIESPTENTVVSGDFVVQGRGEPGAVIILKVDGNAVTGNEVQADGSFQALIPVKDYPNGQHTLTAIQTASDESTATYEVLFVIEVVSTADDGQ